MDMELAMIPLTKTTKAGNSFRLIAFAAALLVPLLLIPAIKAQEIELTAGPQNRHSNKSVAFVNVNVIPMDRERILKAQTVII